MKSPLRYPGGKTRAIPILTPRIPEGTTTLLSPFFGGGSFELSLKNVNIKANDIFEPLYTFWSEVKRDPRRVVTDIALEMPVSKEKFLGFRKHPNISAAEYFIINRCSFSGSTFCGGYSQQAAHGRLTESSIDRILKLDLSRVQFERLDCIDFLRKNPPGPGVFIYADPPYYIDSYVYGRDGDLHQNFNHEAFRTYMMTRNDWIMSYNDCEYIRSLYHGCRFEIVKWSYGMNSSKRSNEMLIYPPETL